MDQNTIDDLDYLFRRDHKLKQWYTLTKEQAVKKSQKMEADTITMSKLTTENGIFVWEVYIAKKLLDYSK